AVSLAHVLRFDDEVAEPRPRWNVNLKLCGVLFARLTNERLVSVDARFRFRMSRLWRHPDPLKLALQSLAALAFRLLCARQTFLLLFEPRRVVAVPRYALPA